MVHNGVLFCDKKQIKYIMNSMISISIYVNTLMMCNTVKWCDAFLSKLNKRCKGYLIIFIIL